ncbi:fungal specific transcription factor domain-containing protein [Aspergillus aculeatinus CBS 121060]|uniref:Uncharacterized protein n=1 Tax=Aspergillus aculeatinus CBS 121060 TaxID=1448322 RepID=A0ACD1H3K5_9EURO|nr:hypothetical protein BO66DRAFT_455857 [Aspergillus aculeatinus CBS 121060]RAH68084.1 hypothetical protein BO66DRAFT_455857 [Aspergillus aculeatinus CBS 121060]
MSTLFADTRWRDQNVSLLQNLSKPSAVLETSIRANSLPPPEEAHLLFNAYLNGSHVQNPFLLRRDVQQLYHSVFSGAHGAASRPNLPPPLQRLTDFRVFMILAIGAVPLYRSGRHTSHPYGYFLAAMDHLDFNVLSKGLDSIQDLLLVVRFGIYHHIGRTSIWELTTLCMRMCIEQNLHRPPRAKPGSRSSLLHQQMQRRVFWKCYMIDRYSSITLDRPFAIAEKDIQIGLPADASDEEIDAAEASGSFPDLDSFCRAIACRSPGTTTEMSVFFLCVRLRKITSKIHARFRHQEAPVSPVYPATMQDITASGRIYGDLEELLQELQEWRLSAPVFPAPQSLYQMQVWYDLLLMRERLLLVRKAIDLVPKSGNTPPEDLLSLCLEYAIATIQTFCPLFDANTITYTRSYFQMLFTAGLSVMFCLSSLAVPTSAVREQAVEAVEQSERALKRMGKELPDAVHYIAVYEALRSHVISKMRTVPRSAGEWDEACRHERATAQEELLVQGDANPYPANSLDLNHKLHSSNNNDPPLENDPQLDPSLFSLDIFDDSTFWNTEYGLGEYAYGDPLFYSSLLHDESL